MIMKYLLVGAGFAFLGILPLPIEAYHLVRWVVAATCLFAAFESFQRKIEDKSFGVVLGVIALVYNPIAPFYLSRGIWLVIDVLAGCFMIWAAFGGSTSLSNKPELLTQELVAKVEEKLQHVEKKSDDFMKRTLVSAILLLIFVVVINLAMKK